MTDQEYALIREWILELDRNEISLNDLLTKLHRYHFEASLNPTTSIPKDFS